MSVFTAVFLGLVMGVIFGVALEKSRVFESGIIVGQMQMKRFTMLKVFLAAVITGLIVIAAMTGFGYVKLAPKATLILVDAAGGALLGIGIVIAGACPGTVFAQIGAGYRDAWFTFVGGVFGALVFTYMEPGLRPYLDIGGYGKLTLDQVIGQPFYVVALAFAALLLAVVLGIEKLFPSSGETGAHADGAS